MTHVAALQFASGTDVGENLETCLNMIDRGAREGAQLLVLPEFCNHISWYDDASQAWDVALAPAGDFLREIAVRARRHACYIIINVSLRRPQGHITVTSLCFDPAGDLCGSADKQTLMGHENTWFARAETRGDVVSAPFGRFAMFPCRDGVTCETPRGLALRGAQLFCDSLNSFALDEASLHVPARAPENKVFLVAANKVGPLIPEHLLQAVSEQTHIPLRFLQGAGESQIVDPLGRVLARGPGEGEAVVMAELDLSLADDKRRPDGTDIFLERRPELYRAVAEAPAPFTPGPTANEIKVATLLPVGTGASAIDELPALIARLPDETVLAVLPELFCQADLAGEDATVLLADSDRAMQAMQSALAGHPQLALCTSLYLPSDDGVAVFAVLIGRDGVIGTQPRLHSSAAAPGLALGEQLQLVDMPWGRMALLSGHDAIFPEIVKVAVIEGAQLIALPSHYHENWEADYGLLSRAAENRVCLVASSPPLDGRGGLILDLEEDFTLMTEWKTRAFDGYINAPRVTRHEPGQTVTVATVHPAAANNKLMSEQTDLILDRPWRLSRDLLRRREEN